MQNPALMATKTSILIFYLRMSKDTQKLLRVASYVTLGLVNVSGVVLTFLNAFQCRPPSAAYTVGKQGKCMNIIVLYLCQSPVNIICNLAILVLPIPVLTGMRLPTRQKVVLVGTFALGIFVTIVDVVRIYYLQKAVDNQLRSVQRYDSVIDFSWNASQAYMWTAVEVNIGIICACVPTLKPLIKKILPSMITDRTSGRGSTLEKGSQSPPLPPPPAVAAQDFQSLPPAHDEERGPDGEMSFLDFLTAPESAGGGTMNRTATVATMRTGATENSMYFGFVNMKKPRSMLKLRGREAFKYCITVTILFFLWGFSYGLLNTLNNEIAGIARQSQAQTLGLTTAYFGAYLFGALTVGQWVLRHAGFKATFITGLCIYGIGTLCFWPSAVLTSYPGFVISNFIVAFGLSILETAANPFLALCGPVQHAELRLLLAQGVQAVGSVLSSLLAQKVMFRSVEKEREASLIDVQWTYLGIALFDVMLALFFYYMPLPEASDSDLEHQSEKQGVDPSQTVFTSKLPLIYTTLGLAVFAQFCYVAAQEGISIWVGPLLNTLAAQSQTALTLTPSDYALVGHSLFAISRFSFGFLTLIIAPRHLLMICFIGCIVFTALTASVQTTGNGVSAFILMFFFFEGPIWPLIFAIGLRGMGRRTKVAAAMITAAASGGGLLAFVMWGVQRLSNKSVQYSYLVNVAIFAFGCLFPIYLILVPKARRQVEPYGTANNLPEHEHNTSDNDGSDTPIRRLSRRFSIIFAKIGGTHGKPSLDEEPVFEHRESRSRATDEHSPEGSPSSSSKQAFPERGPRSHGGQIELDNTRPMTPDFVDCDFGADIDRQLEILQEKSGKAKKRESAEEMIWNSWEEGVAPRRREVARLRGEVEQTDESSVRNS